MPAKRKTSATPTAPRRAPRRTCQVLLVEADAASRDQLKHCGTAQRPMCVTHTATLAEARRHLQHHPVDLAVLTPDLPDGSGFDLAAELARDHRAVGTVIISDTRDFQLAQQALRSGVSDLIDPGTDAQTFSQRIADVMQRKQRDVVIDRRLERLHRLCHRINQARVEVSRQVDVLCNDLVIAYQELALQMQSVVQHEEFTGLIHDELDLETLLRKTLEHLMTKLGPANAAIFLPATLDEYSLGGYVNYDCTAETADLLLEQLGDELAPRVAQTDDLIHLTQAIDIETWAGQHARMLDHAGLVAAPCMSGDECLAVLVLFRDLDQPFEHEHLDRVSALAPMLGDALEKIIRVHHRSVFNENDPDNYGIADTDDDNVDGLPF